MDLQPVFDIAEICYQKGIDRAIISPGSRNAPLTLAFVRHPDIQCFSVPDERSAAFIGLGMSLKTKKPTVLICTSGSAGLNYAPAIAEAYFAQVPLLVLTADRPPEWIGQLDGQTVFQEELFGKHIKKSFSYPDSFEHQDSKWHGHRVVNEAINTANQFPQGPVHINLPFREPFYPKKNEQIEFNKGVKIINSQKLTNTAEFDYSILEDYRRVLILLGQNEKNKELTSLLSNISASLNIPVVADVISNGHEIKNCIQYQDAFLKNVEIHGDLKPELIITLGLSVISKNLKIFIRKNTPKAHWHIQQNGEVADTFKCLTEVIETEPHNFFTSLKKEINNIKPKEVSYFEKWQLTNASCKKQLKSLLNEEPGFNEFAAFETVLSAFPESADLHLANSMAVRYANLISIDRTNTQVFCNRGTSGIDGSNSTALGSALCTERQTILLTGDMAFFYDRNAFWHNHIPKNLKVIVFNNHGGGIFRMIDGPRDQGEYEEFFETRQELTAKNTSEENGFKYYHCSDKSSLEQAINEFFSLGNIPSILEIETDSKTNQEVYSRVMGVLQTGG